MIFDTHAHYLDSRFDEDREELLSSFNSNGIKYVTEVCAAADDIDSVYNFTKKYDFIYGALGVHPSETDKLTENDMNRIKELAMDEKIVAVGEIGLDYHFEDDPSPEVQKKWFIRQMEVAKEVKLPIIVHSRDAAKDTLDIMKDMNAHEIGGVIHCYSYSPEMAREFLNMGFYIGIGGVVTFKNAKKLKEVVEMMPADRILLETDCPYMAPTPHRGERNSSLFIPLIIEEIANIKGLSYDEVADITMKNALTMYGIKE
ncbi:MAG: TatD family hydrolase [Lachnospiraceae bacterium]|nr:TatD family hydrolase [Lachnospiraceae bacterium]